MPCHLSAARWAALARARQATGSSRPLAGARFPIPVPALSTDHGNREPEPLSAPLRTGSPFPLSLRITGTGTGTTRSPLTLAPSHGYPIPIDFRDHDPIKERALAHALTQALAAMQRKE